MRRLRPFLRRAASTRRPFFVDMRSMKPWTRLRRRLCGWKVRFTGRVLQTTEKVPDPRQQSTISRASPQRQGRPPECEMFLRFPHVWKTLWTTGAGGGPQTPVPCRFLPVSQRILRLRKGDEKPGFTRVQKRVLPVDKWTKMIRKRRRKRVSPGQSERLIFPRPTMRFTVNFSRKRIIGRSYSIGQVKLDG